MTSRDTQARFVSSALTLQLTGREILTSHKSAQVCRVDVIINRLAHIVKLWIITLSQYDDVVFNIWKCKSNCAAIAIQGTTSCSSHEHTSICRGAACHHGDYCSDNKEKSSLEAWTGSISSIPRAQWASLSPCWGRWKPEILGGIAPPSPRLFHAFHVQTNCWPSPTERLTAIWLS